VSDGGIDGRLVPPLGIGLGGPADVECLIAGSCSGTGVNPRCLLDRFAGDYRVVCGRRGELLAVDRADVEASYQHVSWAAERLEALVSGQEIISQPIPHGWSRVLNPRLERARTSGPIRWSSASQGISSWGPATSPSSVVHIETMILRI
jgi:hypothetical protein